MAPHHTMLGLGPIATTPSKPANNTQADDRMVNHTMAGMPCISATMSKSQASELGRSLTQAPTPAKPLNVVPEPSIPEPVIPAPSKAASSNDDDPLAGLAGVSAAPVPSSLVDEEFVDLTAKLFGDDFASICNEVSDEEDDGWDFDTVEPPAPLNLSQKLIEEKEEKEDKSNATVRSEITQDMLAQLKAAQPKGAQPISSSTKDEAKPAEKAEAKPAEKTEDKPAEKTEPKPAEKTEAKPAEKSEDKPAKKAEEKSTTAKSDTSDNKPAKTNSKAPEKANNNVLMLGIALIAGIAAIVGAIISSSPILIAIAAVALILDAISTKLAGKLGNNGMFVIFVILAIAILGGAFKFGEAGKVVLFLSGLCHLVCAVIYLNRKN